MAAEILPVLIHIHSYYKLKIEKANYRYTRTELSIWSRKSASLCSSICRIQIWANMSKYTQKYWKQYYMKTRDNPYRFKKKIILFTTHVPYSKAWPGIFHPGLVLWVKSYEIPRSLANTYYYLNTKIPIQFYPTKGGVFFFRSCWNWKENYILGYVNT